MSKISAYAALTLPSASDVLPVVDVSDTSMAASGTTKKITIGNLVPVDWLNVKTMFGAAGDGTTDDTTAVQNALNAANTAGGGVAYFPKGTYLVSSTLTVYPGTTMAGASRYLSVIKQANSTNLDAVIADAMWLSASGSPTADNPVSIRDLQVNGNKANQASGAGIGIVLISFWNNVRDLEIINTFGDGLRLSAWTQAGNKITGSAVESHVFRVDVRNAGGYGIRVYDTSPSTQEVTDGWMADCIIQSPALDGIRVDTSAGWMVRGCHLYGCPQHGIHMGRGDDTRVTGNYIETWGTSGSAGTYAAIAMGDGINSFLASPHPVAVTGNTAFNNGGQTGGTVLNGIMYAVATGTTANLAISGNALYGNGFFTAIRGSHQSSTANSNIALAGNQSANWASDWIASSNGTTAVTTDSSFAREGVTTAKTPSGNYLVTANSGTTSTSAGPWTLGTVYYTPLQVQVAQAYSGLSTNINAAATGGTTPLLIMGLYNDDGTGKPGGSPVSGTQVTLNPVSAGTGNLDVAFGGGNMTLQPGTWWAAWVITSGSALSGQPTVVTLTPLGNTALDTLANSSHKSWQSSTTSSASNLPTGISPVQGSGAWPVIGLKAA